MDLQLKNKTALVTGSTAGIGLGIAEKLFQEGTTDHINGRTQQRVDGAIKQLKQHVPHANVYSVAADFSKAEDVNNLLKQLPYVDILINNVGIFEPKTFADIPDADWLKI